MTTGPRPLLLFLLSLWLAAPLGAATFVRVSDEALADGAAVAVVGKIVAVDPGAGARGGGAAATEYSVRVEQGLKGSAPDGLLRVRVPGGRGADGLSLALHGAPRFRPGERVLLFLERGPGGAFRPLHLFLGAFREVRAGGRSLAVRDLAGSAELRLRAGGPPELAPAEPEPPRDFAAFARWVAARAAGDRRPGGYEAAGAGKYSLFVDRRDGQRLRWFGFETGRRVSWRAHETGQEGIAGGGFAELQVALGAWNDDPGSAIAYGYEGASAVTRSLDRPDGASSVLFNDPNGLVPEFSCATGGVLAIGGPWYRDETETYQGRPHHPIDEADIVLNDGLACFFGASADPSRLMEEILAHELGHTLGLGHACGDAASPPCQSNPLLDQALMRAFVHNDGRGARLGDDDRQGARALYSVGEPPPAPARLQAVALSPVEAKLTWKLRGPGVTEVRVEARTVDGFFVDVGAVAAGQTAFLQGLEPATRYVFRVRASRGGALSEHSNEADLTTPAVPGACVPGPRTLCLHGGRFQATLSWLAPDGRAGAGTVMPVGSAGSGLFWFFSPDNLELLVKVLDGCAANGSYWVFTGPATNLQYTLTVTDTLTGRVRVYFQPQGAVPRGLTDNQAFECL